MSRTTPSTVPADAAPVGSRRAWRLPRLVLDLALAWLALSARAAPLHLDRLAGGMVLTYQPSFFYGSLCAPLGIVYLWRRKWLRAAVALAVSTLFFVTTGFGGVATEGGTVAVLACNIHDNVAQLPRLAELVRRTHADILLFQEAHEEARRAIPAVLSDFVFLHGEAGHVFETPRQRSFTCLTGIRRSLLASEEDVSIETAITGYRTHAVRARVAGRELWLVNVHCTKAFWPSWRVVLSLWKGGPNAANHRGERDRLAAWLEAHRDVPVIVAGDFNAPMGAHNLRLPGMKHAHLAAGSGLHRTFPASWPLWGIDHTFGNERVRFVSYQTVDTGLSDHRAQVARLTLE